MIILQYLGLSLDLDPGLDLGSRSRVCKKWLDWTWTRLWTVYYHRCTNPSLSIPCISDHRCTVS